MSTLAVRILDEVVTQRVNIPRSKMIAGFRLSIIKVGTLTDGELNLDVKLNGNVIATKSYSYQELNTLGNYWHGMKAFEFDNPVTLRILSTTDYLTLDLEISTTSSFTDNVYLGLVHEPHPINVNHLEGEPYYETYGNNPSRDVWNNPIKVDMVILK